MFFEEGFSKTVTFFFTWGGFENRTMSCSDGSPFSSSSLCSFGTSTASYLSRNEAFWFDSRGSYATAFLFILASSDGSFCSRSPSTSFLWMSKVFLTGTSCWGLLLGCSFRFDFILPLNCRCTTQEARETSAKCAGVLFQVWKDAMNFYTGLIRKSLRSKLGKRHHFLPRRVPVEISFSRKALVGPLPWLAVRRFAVFMAFLMILYFLGMPLESRDAILCTQLAACKRTSSLNGRTPPLQASRCLK